MLLLYVYTFNSNTDHRVVECYSGLYYEEGEVKHINGGPFF